MKIENFSLDIAHKLDVEASRDGSGISFRIVRNGRVIGSAVLFMDDASSGYVDEIWIEQSWRRLGIATAVYDHIENNGISLRPSEHMTGEGLMFWENRLKGKDISP